MCIKRKSEAAQRWDQLPPNLRHITNSEDAGARKACDGSDHAQAQAQAHDASSCASTGGSNDDRDSAVGDSGRAQNPSPELIGDAIVPSFQCALYSWELLIRALNERGLRGKKRQSVVKNLRDYGFVALRDARKHIVGPDGKGWLEFRHEHFQRGSYARLEMMQRKRARTSQQHQHQHQQGGSPDSQSK
ncbi:hypothetical protein H4R18_002040 [Coemansia javaensis]|uniref:HSF-type DNA-binding domain-containing protein n=1 Tax=Coemansia javaensis TaxID=2761396 RepID=A0A9W8HHV5_9FUNG|nr:hypothetical protein H4R18_002040 [Coemansia javaensis]